MSVCGRCGSIRAQAVKPTVIERVLAVLRGQQVIVCGRCGWRGRIAVPSSDRGSRHRRRRRRHRDGADAAGPATTQADIDFAALDDALARNDGNP